jgi:hypothetical protein
MVNTIDSFKSDNTNNGWNKGVEINNNCYPLHLLNIRWITDLKPKGVDN